MKTISIITILLLAALAPSYAQQPQPLTDTEQQQWSTFTAREKSATDALNRATVDLIDIPVGADSIAVHSHYQSAWLALQLVRSQRGEWLAKLDIKL
jgi:hypothetical protein